MFVWSTKIDPVRPILSSWMSLQHRISGPICVSRQVRIVNGIEKYVNEKRQMEDEERGALGKPVAKARLRMKSTITLTPISVPPRERKWVDVNPGSYDQECCIRTKAMNRLLRHDHNILQQTDGTVKYEDIPEEFNKKKKDKLFRGCFAIVTQ